MKQCYHRFLSEPWAITAPGAVQFASRFSYEIPANRAEADNKNGDVTDLFGQKTLSTELRDGVGIVRIAGVMISGAGFLEKLFGAVSQQDIVAAVSRMADAKPRAIIMDFDSPGGTVAATPEAASAISKIAKSVPLFSYVEAGCCASAAYWLASQATGGVYATSSSQIGSIGCLLQTASFAEALKAAGISVQIFSSAPLKSTGNPTQKMSEAGAAYLQAAVDRVGEDFVATVQKNRPGAKAEAFDGRLFDAKQAKQLGLIDGVVENISDVIAMAGGTRGTGYSGASATAPTAESLIAQGKFEEAWAISPELKKEFGEAKSCAAYFRGVASGRVQVSKRPESTSYTLEDFKNGKLK